MDSTVSLAETLSPEEFAELERQFIERHYQTGALEKLGAILVYLFRIPNHVKINKRRGANVAADLGRNFVQNGRQVGMRMY